MSRRQSKPKSRGRVIGGWLFFILIIFCLIWLCVHIFNTRIVMPDNSMLPNIQEGDFLAIDRVTYHFTDPARFDVVVFPSKYESDTYYIRRIVGLPGETVQITDGKLYINSREFTNPYSTGSLDSPGLAYQPVTLGADEYFVMSDDLSYTTDSREPSVGNVNIEEITGKIWLKIWPLSHFGKVR